MKCNARVTNEAVFEGGGRSVSRLNYDFVPRSSGRKTVADRGESRGKTNIAKLPMGNFRRKACAIY